MEQLVTVTNVVEASRGQALRQVRRVEERGQESHEHVLLVVQGGFVLCTLPWEQEEPVEDGEGVPGVGISKREDPESLTEPGPLEFQKPGVAGEAGADDGVQHSQGHVEVTEGGTHQHVRERIGRVGDG